MSKEPQMLLYVMEDLNIALCYGGSEYIARGYVDFDFVGDLEKRKSSIGYLFTIGKGAVSQLSKLHSVVALSTIEAEYMVAT